MWTAVTPLLQRTQLKILTIDGCNSTNADSNPMAQTIHNISTLEKVTIVGESRFRLSDAKAILMGAPPSLRVFNIKSNPPSLADLQILARESGIRFNVKD
ncbi:hypothetical protein AC1031_011400 [Aphanomyces cochlioides]|nr:hypothetical protein AC1031_011400 [Aphanomyces cochlioides]